jgi:hypothetical protein
VSKLIFDAETALTDPRPPELAGAGEESSGEGSEIEGILGVRQGLRELRETQVGVL